MSVMSAGVFFNEVKLAQPVPVKRCLNILTVFVRTLQ